MCHYIFFGYFDFLCTRRNQSLKHGDLMNYIRGYIYCILLLLRDYALRREDCRKEVERIAQFGQVLVKCFLCYFSCA